MVGQVAVQRLQQPIPGELLVTHQLDQCAAHVLAQFILMVFRRPKYGSTAL